MSNSRALDCCLSYHVGQSSNATSLEKDRKGNKPTEKNKKKNNKILVPHAFETQPHYWPSLLRHHNILTISPFTKLVQIGFLSLASKKALTYVLCLFFATKFLRKTILYSLFYSTCNPILNLIQSDFYHSVATPSVLFSFFDVLVAFDIVY